MEALLVVCVFFFPEVPLLLFPLYVTHLGVIVLRINWGGPRRVPEPVSEMNEKKIYVHRSVKTRMEAEGLEGGKYTPRAKFEHLNFEWVD